MAAAFTQYPLNSTFKLFQHINRNKCLHRSGEAASVDTVSPTPIQQGITHGQSNRHLLMLRGTGRTDILQIHPGTVPGFSNQTKETIEVVFKQRFFCSMTRLFSW